MPENKEEVVLSSEELKKSLNTYRPVTSGLAKSPEAIVGAGESQYDTGFVIPEENKQEHTGLRR